MLFKKKTYLRTMSQVQKKIEQKNTAILGIAGTGKTNIIKTNIMHLYNNTDDNLFLMFVGYMAPEYYNTKIIKSEEITTFDIENYKGKALIIDPSIPFGTEREKACEVSYICLKKIWNRIKKENKSHNRLYIEEADLLMYNEESAQLLREVMKESQKYNCTTIITSRNLSVFAAQESGLSILKDTPNIILFAQMQGGHEIAANLYDLSYEEKEMISIRKNNYKKKYPKGIIRLTNGTIYHSDFELSKIQSNFMMNNFKY